MAKKWSKKYKRSIDCNNPKGFSQKAHCAGRKKKENVMSSKLEELVGKRLTEEQFDEAAGKKDACYHKVKARYDVWPSAYASGALVKCRKVGAKNWGNKSKKEGVNEGPTETRELKIYIDNDGQLYNQRYMPIIKNLSKKMKKGKFDKRLAVKGFMYLVDDGARKYIRDFGGSKGMFSKRDKIEVAKEFADEFEEIYKNKEYDFMEAYDIWAEDGSFGYTMTGIVEAEYGGRKVKLGKPMQGDVKKFKVYVKNPKGNVVKVNFGHKGKGGEKTMKIRKSNPQARKNFRARHNCDNPGPRHKARYWSCKKW